MMKYLGIDPGSKLCGWAIVDVVLDKPTVECSGHGDDKVLRGIINGGLGKIDGIIIEQVVHYKVSNPRDLLATAYMIGRIQEMMAQSYIPGLTWQELSRPQVIQALTGRWPGRDHKVSKTQLQTIVKDILGVAKPIRPQHANDAVAVVLALTNPVERIINVKPTRKGRRKPAPSTE